MPRVLSWPLIVAILIGEAVFVGFLLGFIDTIVPLPQAVLVGGVGAAVGVLAAFLLSVRRNQLAARDGRPP
ncbi:hypothetical protein [Zavarzinia sp. CC-PAN008]|uniref:hypothetical protein n=1 Tax=Zavarzinia sp. CC-PAN008 TaxID=3243332 RepID=UPI003F7478BC